MKHLFTFSKATWLGQGTLLYTHAKEPLRFNTRWQFEEIAPAIFQAKHKVEIQGADEGHLNLYTFYPIDEHTFRLVVENSVVGQVEGRGFIEGENLGWKLATPLLKGWETFTRLDENTYSLQGEYFTEEITSKIEGKIWKKFE